MEEPFENLTNTTFATEWPRGWAQTLPLDNGYWENSVVTHVDKFGHLEFGHI